MSKSRTLDDTIKLYEEDIEKYNKAIELHKAITTELVRVRDELQTLVNVLKSLKSRV